MCKPQTDGIFSVHKVATQVPTDVTELMCNFLSLVCKWSTVEAESHVPLKIMRARAFSIS